MRPPDSHTFDFDVARTRIVLSLLAMLSLYIDPTAGGLFHLTRYALITLLCHFAYSVIVYVGLHDNVTHRRMPRVTAALDLLFAGSVTYLTEGQTSPSYVFFVFAIIATGMSTGLRATLSVTICAVALYLAVIGLAGELTSFYSMRAVYLGIAGYLVGFFVRQRLGYEERLRELEALAERQAIARSLHDGYIQALAGVSLRLETCRDMLLSNQPEEALAEVRELQTGVAREYDEVREYVRSLAMVDTEAAASLASYDTEFCVRAEFAARATVVEHIIQIVLEGIRNAQRHGQARSGEIDIRRAASLIHIAIDDDGIGFEDSQNPPWTIASRVAEFGGRLTVQTSSKPGAHLRMEIPAA